MMWIMMLCCIGPILFVVLFGAGAKSLGAPSWIILALIAVFVAAHFFMMGRSHKHHVEDGDPKEQTSKKSSGHSGCH